MAGTCLPRRFLLLLRGSLGPPLRRPDLPIEHSQIYSTLPFVTQSNAPMSTYRLGFFWNGPFSGHELPDLETNTFL